MIVPNDMPHRFSPQQGEVWSPRVNPPKLKNPDLNTLDDVLTFTRKYSAEIRQDANARRVYRSFVALTNNQFEALLAFSIWKVRGQSFSFE